MVNATAAISHAGDTIKMAHPGAPNDDAWLGNQLIDPSKGRYRAPPLDERRADKRDSFFDILNQRGLDRGRMGPEKDSWLGHRLVDPTKGKGYVPDPAVVKEGRRDLFANLKHVDAPSGGPGEGDPARLDAWIGHTRIDPHRGRSSLGTQEQKSRQAARFIPIGSLLRMEAGPPQPTRTFKISGKTGAAGADTKAAVQWVAPPGPDERTAGVRRWAKPKAGPASEWPVREDFHYMLEGEIGRAAKQKVFPVPGTEVHVPRSPMLRTISFTSAQGVRAMKVL